MYVKKYAAASVRSGAVMVSMLASCDEQVRFGQDNTKDQEHTRDRGLVQSPPSVPVGNRYPRTRIQRMNANCVSGVIGTSTAVDPSNRQTLGRSVSLLGTPSDLIGLFSRPSASSRVCSLRSRAICRRT